MVKRVPTRKQLKQAESERFLAHVKATLDEAHEAASKVAEKFMKTAKRAPDGHISDLCDGAWVVVYKPSHRLRTALKSLGEIEKGYRGAWGISQFRTYAKTQSVTAHERACEAARGVLKNAFPDDGEFYVKSYLS
jgi:hypothetical protein